MIPVIISGGGVALSGWPDDFDRLLACAAPYEGQLWEHSANSQEALNAAVHQFARRYLSGPLAWLAWPLPMSLLPPHILQVLGIPLPSRPMVPAASGLTKAMTQLSGVVQLDPKRLSRIRLRISENRGMSVCLGRATVERSCYCPQLSRHDKISWFCPPPDRARPGFNRKREQQR
jgi:hypothetical protein